MAYPEKNASYRHTPKFLDRAIAAEGRADGGGVAAQAGETIGRMAPYLGDQDQGPLLQQSNYLDYHRSVDDIVAEGSNPSANARFHSSSGRNPDRAKGGRVRK